MIHVRSFATAVGPQLDGLIAAFLNSLAVPHEDTLFLGVDKVIVCARESENVATAQAQLTAAALLAAQTIAAAASNATALLEAAAVQSTALLEAASVQATQTQAAATVNQAALLAASVTQSGASLQAGFGGCPSGSLLPPYSVIVDAEGDLWTLSGTTVRENGVAVNPAQSATQILWVYGHLYIFKADLHWYRRNGNSWTDVGTAQPGS